MGIIIRDKHMKVEVTHWTNKKNFVKMNDVLQVYYNKRIEI